MSNNKADVLLVAGGSSLRFSKSTNKTLYLLDGEPIFLRSVKKWLSFEPLNHLIITVPHGQSDIFNQYLKQISLTKLKPYKPKKVKITVINGGKERYHSVLLALKELISQKSDSPYIFIHDAARPFFSLNLINKLWEICQTGFASAPLIKINDLIRLSTLHDADADDNYDYDYKKQSNNFKSYATQTPQVILRKWVAQYFITNQYLKLKPRDEISIIEHHSLPLKFVEGELFNIKITHFSDIKFANDIVKLLR